MRRREFLFGAVAAAVSKALPAPPMFLDVDGAGDETTPLSLADITFGPLDLAMPELPLSVEDIRCIREYLDRQTVQLRDVMMAVHNDTYQRAVEIGLLRESALVELEDYCAVIRPTTQFLDEAWKLFSTEGGSMRVEELPGPTSGAAIVHTGAR